MGIPTAITDRERASLPADPNNVQDAFRDATDADVVIALCLHFELPLRTRKVGQSVRDAPENMGVNFGSPSR